MYPIMALFIFFASGFVGMTLVVLISIYSDAEWLIKLSETFPELVAIPIGAFGVACSHYYLKHRWTKQKSQQIDRSELLDAEVSEDELI